MEYSAGFFAAAIVAVVLTGAAKGGLGGAFGGVAVPILSFFISPVQAAAIMLPLLCLIDVAAVRAYWARWNPKVLKVILPGGLIGIALGTASFGILDSAVIRVAVGSVAVCFAAANLFGLAKIAALAGHDTLAGIFWSTISGFTSFIAHAGVPPLMVYLLPRRLDQTEFVATMSAFFLIVNLVKLGAYHWLGQLSPSNLGVSLLLVPFVPLGVVAGLWMQRRLTGTAFYRLAQLGMLVAGVLLIRSGLSFE